MFTITYTAFQPVEYANCARRMHARVRNAATSTILAGNVGGLSVVAVVNVVTTRVSVPAD